MNNHPPFRPILPTLAEIRALPEIPEYDPAGELEAREEFYLARAAAQDLAAARAAVEAGAIPATLEGF